MKRRNYTYRSIIYGCLLIAFLFTCGPVAADESQEMINKQVQILGMNAGDASPESVYNPDNSEYFVVYTDFDESCLGYQKMYGARINAITGEKNGDSIILTECSNSKISDLDIVYNQQENEFLIVYKSSAQFGSKVLFLTISASTFSIKNSPIELASDPLSDPFENTSIALNPVSNRYMIGYHVKLGANGTEFNISYVNADTKSISLTATKIDKNSFSFENNGITNSRIAWNNGNIFSCFEVSTSIGTEIWAGYLEPSTGDVIIDFIKVSPTLASGVSYINPSFIVNSSDKEIVVVYEESYYQISTASLNYKIKAQKIHSQSGALLSPINKSITTLPSDPNTEDAKNPSIQFSKFSNEYIVFFYGSRWINSNSNTYNSYIQRVDKSNLTPIGEESTIVAVNTGTPIAQNHSLRNQFISHNPINNQFLLGWNNESDNFINTQIWRYDNNSPKNLAISNTTQNENKNTGSKFAAFSAIDPDPEDEVPIFSFVVGPGSTDNSYFSVNEGELKVAKILNYEESETRSIRVRATDNQGKYIDKSFLLTINDINEKPTNLRLSKPLTVKENLDPLSFSTNIYVDDQDNGDTHTFTLVSGSGSDNNSNFSIASGTNVLKLAISLNFEATPQQFIRIKATDKKGLATEKPLVFSVIDINEMPEAITLTPSNFPENNPQSTAIIDVVDPDNDSNYSFSLSQGEGDEDNDKFSLIDNELKPSVALDYEVKNSFKVRLKATDGEFIKMESFTISVLDMNDAPDSITLNKRQIQDGMGLGYAIDNFVTYDQDKSDNHHLELIKGTKYFFIDDLGYLITKSALVFNDNEPSANFIHIKVKSTDDGGLSVIQSFTIEVTKINDKENPRILDFFLNPNQIKENSDSVTVSIKATDNQELQSVEFFYRPIRSQGSYMSLDTIYTEKEGGRLFIVSASINTNMSDEMGLSYYFRVTDAAQNVDSTDIGYIYNQFDVKPFDPVNKTFNGSQDSYKIISNPYNIDNDKASRIFADYPSSSNDTWRLFEYEFKKTIEIGTSNSGEIKQGHGYWFNKSDNLNQLILFENTQVSENNWDNLFVINLEKGWNMIGNPYPFQLDWNEVLNYNGYANEGLNLYSFNEKYFETFNLKEFAGGFVFANQKISLEIPLGITQNNGGRISKNEENWLVNFTLDNGKQKNEMGGFGMAEFAKQSYDNFDRPLLPRFLNHLDMYFDHPEHFSTSFAQDVVNIKDNHIWEFVASTNYDNKNITISWNANQVAKAQNKLILYDVLQEKAIDMQMNVSHSFALDQQATFKIIYGDKSYIQNVLSKMKIEALSPYPNPFNDLVTIPINLPYSNNEYKLEYNIFNLLGEKVYNRNIDHVGHGLYNIDWDAGQNMKIKKGIYIYSIKVTNNSLSKNFHGRIVRN